MQSQSRMMRGLHSNRTRGRKARREGGGDQDNPRDEQPIRSVLEHDEHSERVQFWRIIKQLRRGAGDRSARVLILTFRRCQGRENFSELCPRNFSALFLDKMSAYISYKQIVWEREGVTPSQRGDYGSRQKSGICFLRDISGGLYRFFGRFIRLQCGKPLV